MATGKRTKEAPKRTASARAPKLDAETLRRRAVLAKMEKMTPEELVALAVHAGILDENHQLTAPYRGESGPSGCRPTD